MIKIILNVQGMACPKCEARVNKAIQDSFPVESVTASHKKGIAEIISKDSVDSAAVKAAVEAAGYTVTGVSTKKKGLFGLWV